MKTLLTAILATSCALFAQAGITIGTTDDPKASEIDLGDGSFCLVFSNGNANAWTFTPRFPLQVEKMLVVGGGGSGGDDCGAGGGGGAVLYTNYLGLAAGERPVLYDPITFTVGKGGDAATGSSRSGKLGSASEITMGGVLFKAYGGGGGGHWGGAGSLAAVEGEIASGGGKGNGAFTNYRTDGKGYNSLYGHRGGANNGTERAGGGGGAGGDGADATSSGPGRGGIGVTNEITGVAHLYGSGGCGGRGSVLPVPYEGGGSRAGGYSIHGTDGLGGGGAGSYSGGNGSGRGGCGTVILVVRPYDDGIIRASVQNAFSMEGGEDLRCSVDIVTTDVTAKWSLAEEGPFELDEAPTFAEPGLHYCWCRLTRPGSETLVLRGAVEWYLPGVSGPLDIAVSSDPSVFQRSCGGDGYILCFTNFAPNVINITPLRFMRVCRMLVVGGGGAGGFDCGGGGGGGGVVYGDYSQLDDEERPLINRSFSVSIGQGAPRNATSGKVSGLSGNPTTLSLATGDIVAYGGAGGGAWPSGQTPRSAAREGEIGSGGGSSTGGSGNMAVDGLGYNSAQGNRGGYGYQSAGGGGGGAGGVGDNASSSSTGRGGMGFACDISGEMHYYGSGGTGGNAATRPEPYEGGGAGNGGNAVNFLGGGGGGGAASGAGGSGGSGCVYMLVRLLPDDNINATIFDHWGPTDGEAYSNELVIVTEGTTVKWSLAGEEGPFDLVYQPEFNTPGIHTNWCQISKAGMNTLVLQGVIGLRAGDGDYYVDLQGSDKTGFGTVDYPLATIEKALSLVHPGYTIHLAAGNYCEYGLVVDKAISIVGDNAARQNVVIDGEVKGRTLSVTCEGAMISGVTLANGIASGGGNLLLSAGVVSNCVVKGGYGQGSYNGGNAYISGGWILDSELKSGGSAGRGGGATLSGSARMIRCYVHGNSVTDSGGGLSIIGNAVVENCLVTGNSGTYGGGVQMNSQNAWLVNCTVAGNSGTYTGVFHELSGGNAVNCVVSGSYYTKRGTTRYCGLTSTPSKPDNTPVVERNVTITSDVFENLTTYLPKKDSVLGNGGSNSDYAAHAVSATDYRGAPRRQSVRVDIGCYELPPWLGSVMTLR